MTTNYKVHFGQTKHIIKTEFKYKTSLGYICCLDDMIWIEWVSDHPKYDQIQKIEEHIKEEYEHSSGILLQVPEKDLDSSHRAA
jgi:hypothetical protein